MYPKYIDRANGAYVYCGDKSYIDYTLGLGAVILGHADPDVVLAVNQQLGNGTIFGLPHPKETELAELVCDIIPSAEMCRFLKTGSEATSAAVKIARAYTGKKKIVACGYHGWHDWYSSTCKPAGCIDRHVVQVKYNDLEAFQKKVNQHTAAVIMEPYIYEQPKEGFLKGVRKLCDENKALLIFDEVVTGFRTEKFSAQALYKIMPDLTCLGKSMANGIPISCVCGKKELMNVLTKDCFVSSTFGGDLVGIVAAIETIKKVRSRGYRPIEVMGFKLKEAFNRYSQNRDLFNCKCIGLPQRTKFEFPSEAHRALFWQECLKMGVLFGYAQFMSYAHTMPVLDKTVDAIEHATRILRKFQDKPEEKLEGTPPSPALREEVKNEARNTNKA